MIRHAPHTPTASPISADEMNVTTKLIASCIVLNITVPCAPENCGMIVSIEADRIPVLTCCGALKSCWVWTPNECAHARGCHQSTRLKPWATLKCHCRAY